MFEKPLEDIRRGVKLALSDSRWVAFIVLFAAVDQLSKFWVIAAFELYETHPIVPGFFNLVYVQNRGAAFGIFSTLTSPLRETVLLSATVLALSVVFAFLGSTIGESRLGKFALALVCGGALGNLIDRSRLGYVIDFLDFHIGQYHWPAFNLADSYICIGVGILVFLPKSEPQAGDTAPDTPIA
jgi:signal peptidase II